MEKKDKVPKMYFKIFKSKKNNQFYFNLVSINGKIIGSSEGYKTKQSAIKTIRNFGLSFFSFFKSKKNNQFYFNFRSPNKKIIFQSESYTRLFSLLKTYESIRKNILLNNIDLAKLIKE